MGRGLARTTEKMAISMRATHTMADYIKLAHQCSADEFFERLGGHVLAGAPEEEHDGDASTAIATVVWSGASVGSAVDITSSTDITRYQVHVIRQVRQTLFGKAVLAGRSSKNDICIQHESVSKVHAKFRETKSGAILLSDCGSSNGTQVNGAFVAPGEEVELQHRDEVRLGSRDFRFYDGRKLHATLSRIVPELGDDDD